MPGPKYTIVPTKTPGVVFVVVHPKMRKEGEIPGATQPGDDHKVGNDADYIVLCDGRPVDGMKCEMLPEAATSRFSYHPLSGNAPAAIPEEIGSAFVYSYADFVIQSHGTVEATAAPKAGTPDKAAQEPEQPAVQPPPPPAPAESAAPPAEPAKSGGAR